MTKIYLIVIITVSNLFSISNKFTVEIYFSKINELDKLVKMGIDLDHYRTKNSVHAYVNHDEFNQIQNLGFKIYEIQIKQEYIIIN